MMSNTSAAERTDSTDGPLRKGGRTRINSIYRCVRDRICFFEYPPGTVLREVALAQEFGVSRTPIRQILQMLETERLVDIHDGVGTIVTGVDFRRLRDVYDLRLRITTIIGDFMSTSALSKAAIAIDGLIVRAEELRREPESRAFWVVESDRHRLINSLIENEPLREIHDSLYTQTSRVWYDIVDCMWEEALGALLDELRELRRALLFGNADAVAFTSRNYVSYSMTRLSKHFDPIG